MNTPPLRATLSGAPRSRSQTQVRAISSTTPEWNLRAMRVAASPSRASRASARISGRVSTMPPSSSTG